MIGLFPNMTARHFLHRLPWSGLVKKSANVCSFGHQEISISPLLIASVTCKDLMLRCLDRLLHEVLPFFPLALQTYCLKASHSFLLQRFAHAGKIENKRLLACNLPPQLALSMQNCSHLAFAWTPLTKMLTNRNQSPLLCGLSNRDALHVIFRLNSSKCPCQWLLKIVIRLSSLECIE